MSFATAPISVEQATAIGVAFCRAAGQQPVSEVRDRLPPDRDVSPMLARVRESVRRLGVRAPDEEGWLPPAKAIQIPSCWTKWRFNGRTYERRPDGTIWVNLLGAQFSPDLFINGALERHGLSIEESIPS